MPTHNLNSLPPESVDALRKSAPKFTPHDPSLELTDLELIISGMLLAHADVESEFVANGATGIGPNTIRHFRERINKEIHAEKLYGFATKKGRFQSFVDIPRQAIEMILAHHLLPIAAPTLTLPTKSALLGLRCHIRSLQASVCHLE